jgi:hypothetical protein
MAGIIAQEMAARALLPCGSGGLSADKSVPYSRVTPITTLLEKKSGRPFLYSEQHESSLRLVLPATFFKHRLVPAAESATQDRRCA